MALAAPSGTDEERAARRLIEQMSTILSGLRDDIPDGFARALFAGAAPEDLLQYEPREIAALAEDAWALLQERKPGTPKVRVDSRAGPIGAERIKLVSIIEIVNDDMPFLLDSVLAELTEQGIDVRLVVHPIFTVERDHSGLLFAFRGNAPAEGGALRESFIHVHTARIETEARESEIAQALEQVLGEVSLCVRDWRPMLGRIEGIIGDLKKDPPPLPVEEIAEAVQLLKWLAADNFAFLGFRHYALAAGELEAQHETGLGILRNRDVQVLRRGDEPVVMTPEIREFLSEPKALIITKANMRSRVHRRGYLDYIGLKHFDADGALIGEYRIVGLFTSTAYTRSTRSIPYLRRKVDAVLTRAGFRADSHSGKALLNVLETYPRDELFQVDEDTLLQFSLTIMQLGERPRIRVLARRDRFDRFVSILVFVPREHYDSAIRIAIGNFLADIYRGRVSAFYPFFTEGPLVRVHFIIGRSQGETPHPTRANLEQAITNIVRTWTEGLHDALMLVHDSTKALMLHRRYRNAFTGAYREVYPPATAIGDIRAVENLTALRPLGVDFYRPPGDDRTCAGLKVWSLERPIPLSERVPVLENMGFRVVDERTYRIEPAGSEGVWLYDMMLEHGARQPVELEAIEQRLEACFLAVMRGRAEDDGYNGLVLAAGIPWRDVSLLRAISRFLRQVPVAFSQDYLWTTLRKHAAVAADIIAMFHARFDPRLGTSVAERGGRQSEIRARIETALQRVESLDEDRIIRIFINAVESALRTNYYQVDGDQTKPCIAIKFESGKIESLPRPRPLYEIFIYSPRVEGIHLRFGKVARGGLRWSDRPQDFRTEVLGLVKAQQVKNAVIVPVGAKGGFVPKQLPVGGSREAFLSEGTAAYTLFVSSLLDITDNFGPDGVIPPANVVRYDDDDAYLVVAADKGTATFSDTANGISAQYQFWLGDAFASGGSAGYDHKKMGITARGAWEAVKRHFREMDVDITATPFTVAGVGDMSGDVFGNGMLRERTIRMVAAFDHRDIFIDPDPDPEKSFDERRRLFGLTRSSWQDYDKKLISPGGGVFKRSAKEIRLSPEAQQLFGSADAKTTPHELMKAILKLPVDLLWFGGIGTYVRAATEPDEAAGDRANDAIRVTGAQLRAKVIGEGANLGMTQRGRIEAALHGIRLNNDAIDNSAGVNTSDVEVNIKIALRTPVREGVLTVKHRDALLAEMTDEVAALVLRNNYLQTLAISLAERRALEDLGFQQRLMQSLEARGQLDRRLEFLPDDMEIVERYRRGEPLTRPELAVLLAYAKLSLHDELLQSTVPDDFYLSRELGRYFPKPISQNFPEAMLAHRLRREIIATQLANSMINRGGPSLVVRIADQTGASAAAIAAAFTAVRDSFAMTDLNAAIDALDGKISGSLQLELYESVQDLLLDRIVWFLRNGDLSQGLARVIDRYRAGIAETADALDTSLPEPTATGRAARMEQLQLAGVPQELALRIASLPILAAAPDIVLVSDRSGKPVAEVTKTFFATGAFFQLDRIVDAARAIKVSDYFDRLALDRALDSIGASERRIAAQMVANGYAGTEAVTAWVEPRREEVTRIRAAVEEIAESGLTISKLTVAASLLGDLVKQ